MGVGPGLYMYDVVVKSSRSLSHLLMSSCQKNQTNCFHKRNEIIGNLDIFFKVHLTLHNNFYPWAVLQLCISRYGLGMLTKLNADSNWFNDVDGHGVIKLGIVKPITVT